MHSYFRLFGVLFFVLAATGCNPGGLFGGGGHDLPFQVTPFGGVNAWQMADGVPVNVDGENVGVTGDKIVLPSSGDHVITFGDLSDTIDTLDGPIPVVTLPNPDPTMGKRWVTKPIHWNPSARSARSADTAVEDTAAPSDTDTSTPTGGTTTPALGSYLSSSGEWTCQSQDLSETLTANVTFPDASSMDMDVFGTMDMLGVLLDIPTDGTVELRGNFTGDNTLTVNLRHVDGSPDGIYDCWAGTLADCPWCG